MTTERRIKLVLLTRVPYDLYNRRGLLQAAEAHGVETLLVAFLKRSNTVEFVRLGQVMARMPLRFGAVRVARRLREFASGPDTVILNCAHYTNVCHMLVIRRSLPKALFLFYVSDWFLFDSRFPKTVAKRAVDLAYRRVCDGVLVTSRQLLPHYPGAFHLDSASHTSPAPYAMDHPPRVAIIGSLNRRFDFELIATLAARMPDVEFHLHGWIHENDPDTADRTRKLCEDLRNITYHGAYRNDDLGTILRGCPIGLVPYRTDYHVNRYVNPDKIYHYLCAGMEVVSTPIPQALEMSAYLHVAREADEFAACIRDVLAGRSRRNSGGVLEEFTWTRRWKDLADIVQTIRERRAGPSIRGAEARMSGLG